MGILVWHRLKSFVYYYYSHYSNLKNILLVDYDLINSREAVKGKVTGESSSQEQIFIYLLLP